MNSTQALAKARKLLGAKAFIRVNDKALIGEARQQQRAEFLKARDAQAVVKAALDLRRAAVLRADAEYQRLKSDYAAAVQLTESHGGFNHQRVAIGTSSGMFNTIHAQGDNFSEALDTLAVRRKEAA